MDTLDFILHYLVADLIMWMYVARATRDQVMRACAWLMAVATTLVALFCVLPLLANDVEEQLVSSRPQPVLWLRPTRKDTWVKRRVVKDRHDEI